MEEIGAKRHSATAMFLLFGEGCALLLVSAAVLTCGFVLDMHKNYDTDLIDSQVDYAQYWVGFVFLITAFFAAAAAVRQRNRSLIVTVLVLFLICILVSLFALVVEGNDWIQFNTARKRRDFWENEGYSCPTGGSSCTCSLGTAPGSTIASDVDCDDLNKFSSIYGGLVCCILIGVFIALSSIVIILVLIPIKHFALPEPRRQTRKVTVVRKRPQTPPSPKVVYQRPPKPQVIVKRVERPPPPPQVIVKEVERTPPPPRVIVREVPGPAPPPKVIVREVPGPAPPPKILVREVPGPAPPPKIVVREVPGPAPPPKVIVREVPGPAPPPKIVVKEVPGPAPPPKIVVREVPGPAPPPKIVVREVPGPAPPPKVVVREVPGPAPPPKVIVREVQRPAPPPQVIVREVERPPPPPQMIVREVERPRRQRSMVYEEHRPNLMAIEAPPHKHRRPTQKMISHVYDEGHLVSQPRPRPQPAPMLVEDNFIRNPNFGRQIPVEEPPQGEWVVSRKSTKREGGAYMVVEDEPRYRSHKRSQVRGRAVSAGRHHGERVIVQRPRAHSDERPRVYTTSRADVYGGQTAPLAQGRRRSNSFEEGSRKPRVYTDREVDEFYGAHGGEVRRVENMEGVRPAATAGYGGVDDRVNLEDNYQPAAAWDARPPTPY